MVELFHGIERILAGTKNPRQARAFLDSWYSETLRPNIGNLEAAQVESAAKILEGNRHYKPHATKLRADYYKNESQKRIAELPEDSTASELYQYAINLENSIAFQGEEPRNHLDSAIARTVLRETIHRIGQKLTNREIFLTDRETLALYRELFSRNRVEAYSGKIGTITGTMAYRDIERIRKAITEDNPHDLELRVGSKRPIYWNPVWERVKIHSGVIQAVERDLYSQALDILLGAAEGKAADTGYAIFELRKFTDAAENILERADKQAEALQRIREIYRSKFQDILSYMEIDAQRSFFAENLEDNLKFAEYASVRAGVPLPKGWKETISEKAYRTAFEYHLWHIRNNLAQLYGQDSDPYFHKQNPEKARTDLKEAIKYAGMIKGELEPNDRIQLNVFRQVLQE